jgi:uncharacterized membrane protein
MEGLIVLAILLFLLGPILGIIGIVQASNARAETRRLRRDIEAILQAGGAFAPTQSTVEMRAAEAEVRAEEAREREVAAVAREAEAEVRSEEAALRAEVPEQDEVKASDNWSRPKADVPRNVEQALASRWLVWLGGAAIGLGGLFLVKYMHDQGLIPPIIRVIIGLAIGAALVVAGEWLRLKRGGEAKDYVPAALSAAGLLTAFSVSYAAYALYNILAPAVVFPLLAGISLGAMWLSLRQGPLIAALGLLGATVTPALVSTDNPSAPGFFAYLLVIVVASLWLLRKVNWWWLGFAAVGVGAVWALLWIMGQGTSGSVAIGIFGLAIGAAAVLVPRGKGILDASMGSLWNTSSISPPMGIAIAGCAAGSIVLASLAIQSNHQVVPLMMFAIGMTAVTAFGWFRNGLVAAPFLAAVASLIVLISWREVGFHEWAFDERGFWTTVPGLIEPPRYRTAMLLAMAAFTAVGVFGVLQKAETRPWAILASASAFLFLFCAWGRVDHTLSTTVWVFIALAGAAALALAAKSLLPKIEDATVSRSLEILIVGTVVLLLFALDRLLDGVWLTIAIAVLAAALAWGTRIIPLLNIAGIASIVAGFAAARLFVGREFWGEPKHMVLGPHWVLYGYGVPAALFWQASRWLNREGFEKWLAAFEGVSLGLLVSLMSLELRVLIGGGITVDRMTLLELAAHACAWLGAAYGLAYRQQLYSSFISKWGARALLAAATGAFFLCLTIWNPVAHDDPLQGGQFFNALWLAYLSPVALYALIARKLDGLGIAQLRSAVGVFTLVLLMSFVTLFVKRQFQPPVMTAEFFSQAESYAVSAAWLVTGILIFIAGIKLGRQTIRYGGLAVLILTVLKVFGYDLFSLGGLWRIASMIGLGLCLVGVGWLYTRYIGNPAVKKPELQT